MAFAAALALGAWWGLAIAAACHDCPDHGPDQGTGRCEFFGHALQTNVSAPPPPLPGATLRAHPALERFVAHRDEEPSLVKLPFALPPKRGPPA